MIRARITLPLVLLAVAVPAGAGVLPDAVHSDAVTVLSEDPEVRALARLAEAHPGRQRRADSLLDLRRQRDWKKVEAVLADTGREGIEVELDFADGARWKLGRGQSWRFWRGPLTALGE